MPPIIEARGLTKRFGETQALAGLDLVAESGRVTALLGPNGAGKTTFISAVATLLRPDAGELRVAGIDALAHPKQVRQVIGLAGQYASVEPAMTGLENLQMVARLFGLSKDESVSASHDVLERLGLSDAGDRLVRDYSGGMRRRLDLGASLVGRPHLLLLDEPTTGLDPRSRIELWEAIRGLVASGTDVLLTTQYLEEADRLADKIAVIDGGRKIAEGTSAELKATLGATIVEVVFADPAAAHRGQAIGSRVGTSEVDSDGRTVKVNVSDGGRSVLELVRLLDAEAAEPESIAVREPTLDDVFLSLTGHTTAAEAAAEEDAAEIRTEKKGRGARRRGAA